MKVEEKYELFVAVKNETEQAAHYGSDVQILLCFSQYWISDFFS